MKLFAITPDSITPGGLTARLPALRSRGVDFVYLRSAQLENSLETLADSVYDVQIMPIVPFRFGKRVQHVPCGLHYKGHEAALLTGDAPAAGTLITVACHDSRSARALLAGPAAHVFISPVFAPFSKQADTRKPFPHETLKALINQYGEKVVTLGGMNPERVTALRCVTQRDFCVAGVTMFFGGPP